MELYQTYLKDLLEVHKSISDHMSELSKSVDTASPDYSGPPPATGPHSRAARLAAVAELISHGKTCLSNMELEANDVIPAERITIRADIVNHKKRLSKYDADITLMKAKVAKVEREELLKGGKRVAVDASGIPDDLDEESKRERMAMAAVTAKTQGNTDIMRNIERIAGEAERTIQETETTLYKQRENLQNIHQQTRELDSEVSDARRVANQMHKMMVQNKAILLGIIALLVIMIFVIIYVKAVGSGGDTTTTVVIVTLPPSVNTGGGNNDGGLPS